MVNEITPIAQMFTMTMNFNDLVADVERHVKLVKNDEHRDPRQVNDVLELAVGTLQSAKRIMATLTEFCATKDDAINFLIESIEETDEDVPDLP